MQQIEASSRNFKCKTHQKVYGQNKSYLEGWERHNGLVDILIVCGQVLAPVQHLGGVVNEGLLG